jgi:dsDNA-binding SOS-regulon protein
LPATPSPGRTPVPPTPAPVAHPSPTAQPKPPKPPKPDEWTEARHLFEQLSPDQKNKFLDNLDQWKAMSPEEQELFRDRELFRREKIAEEIQDAINKSGLKLDDDQREVYALRYTQERRKIEEALHKEMDLKRQSMVGEMLSRLKLEFSGTPPPAGSTVP